MSDAPAYTCACEGEAGEVVERLRYRVTGHDGAEAVVCYCADCAELAQHDWNGETAAIVEISPLDQRR